MVESVLAAQAKVQEAGKNIKAEVKVGSTTKPEEEKTGRPGSSKDEKDNREGTRAARWLNLFYRQQ